jgi:hypothetical protein
MATQYNNKFNKPKITKPVPAPAAKAAAPAAKPGKRGYEPTQEEIATRAFEIYVSEGCREGSDLENWLRAERELRGAR